MKCGCSSMVRAIAFQAKDAGSIPASRSTNSPASAKQAQTGNPRRLSKVGAVMIAMSLSGCGFFQKKADTNALCIAECPDLTALPDDSFGATSKKLKETADQYYLCRRACQVKK